jgi:spoIIIJ-associated protein
MDEGETKEMTQTSTTLSPRSAEGRGANVEEATASALAELGVAADHAVVEVLSGGGAATAAPGERLSTTQEARVRVLAVDDRTARGRALLDDLLRRMKIEANIGIRLASDEPNAPIIFDVSGDDLGLLIGWRGETLRALQTVLNLMMGEEPEDQEAQRRLIIDIERYRARREEQVRDLALRLAQRVKRSGERYTLDPMQPYERRAVHLALADDSDVRTESSGKEPARRIVIHPTGPAQPDLPDPGYAPRSSGRRGGWRDQH